MKELNQLEKLIGYKFKNIELLRLATTHASYANQNQKKNIESYNERIEFLGDAVLELIISLKLYQIKPALTEGEMSKKRAEIVCEKSLAGIVNKMKMAKYLQIGRCEIATKGLAKPAILADMFEAIVGAVYLDGGFASAQKACLGLLNDTILECVNADIYGEDYKTKLQEMLQKNGNVKIEYKLVKEMGEAHNKTFVSEVYVNDILFGKGKGKTKKMSEQQAAKEGIDKT